jgi:lactoylglutathione lyase
MDATAFQVEAGRLGDRGSAAPANALSPSARTNRSKASAAAQEILALMPVPLPKIDARDGRLPYALLPLPVLESKQECPAATDVEQDVTRSRIVGINHVALEVGDIDEALAFYGRFFEFSLRGRTSGAAFIDIGDQFLALMEGRSGPSDRARHFGLVVEDKEATRQALEAGGVEIRRGRMLDFQDPWGNTVEVVQYDQVQFTKSDGVLSGMGLDLGKTQEALAELQEKGLA